MTKSDESVTQIFFFGVSQPYFYLTFANIIYLGTIQILRNQKGEGWVWPNAYVCLQGGWVLANTYVMNCWNHQKRISF